MSKIKRILVFLAALVLPLLCLCLLAVFTDGADPAKIPSNLPAWFTSNTLYTLKSFVRYPWFLGIEHALFLISCIWWFAKPRKLSGTAMFVTAFFIGPHTPTTHWILGGMRLIAS